MDYKAGFRRPFLDGKKLLIGFLLGIVPIVNWFVTGYYLEATGLTKRKYKYNKMPEWTNWGWLFGRGFLAMLTSLIYMIPALILFFMAFPGAMEQVTSMKMSGMMLFPMVFMSAGGAVAAIGIILWLLAIYLAPMAVLHFVAKDKYGKAFNLGEVCKKAFTGTYFMPWLLAMVISFVITWLVAYTPFVWLHYLVSVFIGFVIGMFMYTWLGQAYKELK